MESLDGFHVGLPLVRVVHMLSALPSEMQHFAVKYLKPYKRARAPPGDTHHVQGLSGYVLCGCPGEDGEEGDTVYEGEATNGE